MFPSCVAAELIVSFKATQFPILVTAEPQLSLLLLSYRQMWRDPKIQKPIFGWKRSRWTISKMDLLRTVSAIQSHLKVTFLSAPSLDVNSGLNIFLHHDFYLGGNFVDSLFVLSAAVATGAPGPPLPADVGSGETKGGACKRLAAAAGIRTGWICHFLLVDLRDHWLKKTEREKGGKKFLVGCTGCARSASLELN